MREEFEFIKSYRDNDALRASFNELAKKTFGLDFEDWYQNGYWGDQYNPYSIVKDGKVVANVSVNRTDFIHDGNRKQLIQLGTVMTEEAYRRQGLIRRLMEEVEQDFKEAYGIYLFANDTVLDFYPKFGFRKAEEYQYWRPVSGGNPCRVESVPMKNREHWSVLEKALKRSVPCGRFEMVDNSGLILFYVTKFMQENIYYDRDQDAYIIAELEEEELLLHHIISAEPVDLNRMIDAFGKKIKRVYLGFTPENPEKFECLRRKEEDTTLFIKGAGLAGFETEKIMFPVLAHA